MQELSTWTCRSIRDLRSIISSRCSDDVYITDSSNKGGEEDDVRLLFPFSSSTECACLFGFVLQRKEEGGRKQPWMIPVAGCSGKETDETRRGPIDYSGSKYLDSTDRI